MKHLWQALGAAKRCPRENVEFGVTSGVAESEYGGLKGGNSRQAGAEFDLELLWQMGVQIEVLVNAAWPFSASQSGKI